MLSPETKFNLITKDLQEIIGTDQLQNILAERDLKVYWGTSPTSTPHIGYICPMLKIADLLDANCEVTILLADLHAFLDAKKSTWEELSERTQEYRITLTALLKQLGVDVSKLKFVVGSSFQLSKEYTIDMYKAHTIVTYGVAKHAGAEVVKQSSNPMMTSLMYPTLQALDEEYLQVDAQLGGIDQRKILTHSQALLPKLGYKERIALMNPMIPALSKSPGLGQKMSASDSVSKIAFTDNKTQIAKKINSAFCAPGSVDDSTLMVLLEKIIFKVLERQNNRPFRISRPDQYGGPVTYANFEALRVDFIAQTLAPPDVKAGITDFLDSFLEPIRLELQQNALKIENKIHS